MLALHHTRLPFFLLASLALGAITLQGSAQTAAVRKRLDTSEPARTPADVEATWSAQVGAKLRQAEYHFSALEAGGFGAPNRAQDLRLSIGPVGLEVVPRSPRSGGDDAPWRLRLRTRSFGRMGDPIELGSARVSASENRIELDHGRLREWFVNEERGLEQGWTIASAPSGVEPVWIGLEVGGALGLRIDEGGRSGRFVDAAGEYCLRYTGLTAFDATGRELEARLAPSPEGVGIAIDDAGAVYPLTVDPVLTWPAWTAESDQAGAFFGVRLATAGDVNGDGYGDVIVGAYFHDNGQTDEGRAFVYLGSGAGLATSPAWTAESDQAFSSFGSSVATAGDVNGDGYGDVIVGAYGYDNGQTNEGRAYVYLGSGAGLATSPAWTAESDQTIGVSSLYPEFGSSVASAGDVNGDGYGDVIVGAFSYANGQTGEGRAFVYLGSGSGLATSPAWTAESDQVNAAFGFPVATAGDVNGDGYGDVIVGSINYSNDQTFEGRAFVYLGSGAGLATSAAWTAESDQAGTFFSNPAFCASVATAGDVNGDGYSDVIVGASQYDNGQTDEGRAFVYLGSGAGLATGAAWTAESEQAGAGFGMSVATAGDVNGDGFSDVIVGASQYDNGQTDEGRAFLYLGSDAGLSTSAAWTAESDQASALYGRSVSTAGDVNGDGYSDVIVGAWLYDNLQTDEGRAFLYLGSGAGLSTSTAWTAEGDQDGATFGWSVSTAGDVNGDGYSDVIVGATNYDNGQTDEGRAFLYLGSGAGLASSATWTAESDQAHSSFGQSVATAGDVNGDGYSDVITAAFLYSNNETDEGRAYVYLGSGTGLSTSAAWTAESDQTIAFFGNSVSTAGDVNGDGYSDVIIGAFNHGNGQTSEGRAYVYLGSGAGLSASAAWTAESNQADAQLGTSVATAGDVNGDGYSDVLVGADRYDNGQMDEGRAFLYLGSGTGLSTSAVWTAEGDQVSSFLGFSVATAGDVNGDGYSDVIVGAEHYDNGETDEGRAFLYLGNEGRGGRVLAPQQRRLFAPQPVAALGRSDVPGFRIQVQHPALAGGGTAFLEWEVKALGVAFNGLGLGRSTTGQPVDPFSALSFDEMALAGHDHLLPCKWRARVVLEGNLFFPSTPWFGIPDNARTETDLRFPRKYFRRASAP